MRKVSREIVFVHTSPEARVQLLKPLNSLQHLEDECEQIYEGGLIKRYTMVTKELEDITLPDLPHGSTYINHTLKKQMSKTCLFRRLHVIMINTMMINKIVIMVSPHDQQRTEPKLELFEDNGSIGMLY